MRYTVKIADCAQIHKNCRITLCGQKVEFFNIKPHGTQRQTRALNLKKNCSHLHNS